MEDILPYATENDVIRCAEIVRKELSNKNVTVNDNVLKEITEDIMGISYAKGGDYSDNIIQSYARTYINYGFYKKFLGRQMSMFKVLDKLCIGNAYCVSVEGNTQLLRNGIELTDEKGDIFVVETVAMTHYQNLEDYRKYAEIVLCGDIENLGETLFLMKIN